MWVSVRANVRVSSAARRSSREALQVVTRAGGFSAIIVVGMAVIRLLRLHDYSPQLFSEIMGFRAKIVINIGDRFKLIHGNHLENPDQDDAPNPLLLAGRNDYQYSTHP